jgi:pyruvate/2-oxoglutarate dehydrogenase complex dihydrolipoamide acyltransferase (E2) component
MMKCACLAIRKFPFINSVYGNEIIKICTDVNFGLAVSLKDGLVPGTQL